jgi:hypothetical protein
VSGIIHPIKPSNFEDYSFTMTEDLRKVYDYTREILFDEIQSGKVSVFHSFLHGFKADLIFVFNSKPNPTHEGLPSKMRGNVVNVEFSIFKRWRHPTTLRYMTQRDAILRKDFDVKVIRWKVALKSLSKPDFRYELNL